MKLIDGKEIRDAILGEVARGVATLTFRPVFCDILVGEDPVSLQYMRMKAKTAESVGIKFHNANFPDNITTEELVKEIKILNTVPNMCGIIVQLPLPEHIDRRMVLDSIAPNLDVDCLGSARSSKFYAGEVTVGFPAALACMAILDSLKVNLTDKKIVVLGQGELVGKPVLALCNLRNLNVTSVISNTENKEQILREADVIISGIGQGAYLKAEMLKSGVILIDAGTSESNNAPPDNGRAGIVGDVDLESVMSVASFVSPVPGGVGPVTVAMLLKNVFTVAKNLK